MIKTKGRVVLSKNPKDVLDTTAKLYEQHKALGSKSPLNLLEDFSWDVTGPKIAPTQTAHKAAEDSKKEMEKQYGIRDMNMPEITEGLKMSINLLKSTFTKNPKKLADWGIEVDDTPKAKKPPKA